MTLLNPHPSHDIHDIHDIPSPRPTIPRTLAPPEVLLGRRGPRRGGRGAFGAAALCGAAALHGAAGRGGAAAAEPQAALPWRGHGAAMASLEMWT